MVRATTTTDATVPLSPRAGTTGVDVSECTDSCRTTANTIVTRLCTVQARKPLDLATSLSTVTAGVVAMSLTAPL